jgi:hypothetical protein
MVLRYSKKIINASDSILWYSIILNLGALGLRWEVAGGGSGCAFVRRKKTRERRISGVRVFVKTKTATYRHFTAPAHSAAR